MDAVRTGRTIRVLRIRRAWRQQDLGEAAGVSQGLVSLVERGHLDGVSLRMLRRITEALGADLQLWIRWRGGEVDRLLDEGHPSLVGRAAAWLEGFGWVVAVEVTFAVYGDRGSIDLLAWHPATSTLLVVEVKTELTSIEATLRSHDTKTRLAAGIAAERFGWRARAVARMLVLPDVSTARRRVDRHGTVLERAYPGAGRDPGVAPGAHRRRRHARLPVTYDLESWSVRFDQSEACPARSRGASSNVRRPVRRVRRATAAATPHRVRPPVVAGSWVVQRRDCRVSARYGLGVRSTDARH